MFGSTRRLPLLFLVIAFCLVSGCQKAPEEQPRSGSQTQADAAPARQGPAIQVEPAEIDFGKMDQNQTHKREVLIRNVGTDTLVIENVGTTCGCTVADLAVKVLAPGASTPLEVSFNSKRFSGTQKKLVKIRSNDPQKTYMEVKITAEVEPPIDIDPSRRFFSNMSVTQGEAWTEVVSFQTKLVPELVIEVAEFNADIMQLEIENGVGGNPQKSTMTMTTRSDLKSQDYSEVIRLKTNVEEMKFIDFTLRARVLGNLRTDPSFLNLGRVDAGQALLGTIRVVGNNPDIPFKVTRTEIDLPGMETEVEPVPDNNLFRIYLKGTAIAKEDPSRTNLRNQVTGKLHIFTDQENQPELTARVYYTLNE